MVALPRQSVRPVPDGLVTIEDTADGAANTGPFGPVPPVRLAPKLVSWLTGINGGRRYQVGAAMMVDRRVLASIELPDGRGTQRCHGPAWEGLCPRAEPDGTIPCAGGRILALHGTWADGAWLTVPEDSGAHCPLAGLVTVVPAPWD